jgi:hypothetical protein
MMADNNLECYILQDILDMGASMSTLSPYTAGGPDVILNVDRFDGNCPDIPQTSLLPATPWTTDKDVLLYPGDCLAQRAGSSTCEAPT